MAYIGHTEPTLSVVQLFRLIEIAHETRNDGIRRAAMDLFAAATNQPIVMTTDVK